MAADFKQLLVRLKDRGQPVQVLLPGPGVISAKIETISEDIVSLRVTLQDGTPASVTVHFSNVMIVA